MSDTRKVERIQERALRIVYNSHSETYMNLLDDAKLPSLLNRRLQDIVILMYKVKYRLVPDFICDIFSLVNIILETKILIFQDLILYCMVNTLLDLLDPFLWNTLDKNVTETSSLSRFEVTVDLQRPNFMIFFFFARSIAKTSI